MGLMDRLFGHRSSEDLRVFISYRRADSAYAASAISDRLTAHFGTDSVFLDIKRIELGVDFADTIQNALRDSDVCLVLIGDSWLERISDPSDWIRLEVESAFAHEKAVIPILVGDARMPLASELPESLRKLTMLSAVTLRTGKDFASNIDRLIHAIEAHAGSDASRPILPENIESEPPTTPSNKLTPKGDSGPSEGSVFISYRRDGGAETARLVRYELLARNWRVFLDVEDLPAGQFDDILLSEVAAADSFLLILTPNALKNCAKETDWVRKEIEQALKTKRNIVPLLKEDARTLGKEELPKAIAAIKEFNCVDYSHVYYDATISKLLSFLKQTHGIAMA